LSQPTFPTSAFARQRDRQLSELDDAERKPDQKAQMVFRESLYGKHPLGRPSQGRRAIVEKLSPQDCAAFHRKVFVPNNAIVAVVGDFDSQAVVDEVKAMTAEWKRTTVIEPAMPIIQRPKEFAQKVVTIPTADQLHFYMGHPGIRRSDPDYFKLLVMDYVLGTGPGFTDRLSARIRDRLGLAYTVQANITNSAGEEPGLFTCYVGTSPENLDKVKTIFVEELERIRKEKPSPGEVDDVKTYLVNSMPLQLTTSASLAAQLVYVERHGLGLSFLETYRRAIEAVTPEDVRDAAAAHLHPMQMILVAAGALGPDGKPLAKGPQPKK